MQTGLLHLHSFLRWIIVLLFLVAIFKSLGAGNKPFTSGHKKAGLFLLIFFDLNVLIGLVQWFTGSFGLSAIQNNGMAVVMKDPVLRFFAVEHITGMILAAILIHIGRAYAKKNVADSVKHRKAVLFYTLSFIITLASVPWPFRLAGAGRGWL